MSRFARMAKQKMSVGKQIQTMLKTVEGLCSEKFQPLGCRLPNVELSRRTTSSKCPFYKAVGEISGPPRFIVDCFLNPEHHMNWNTKIRSMRVLENLSEVDATVVQTVTKTSSALTSRHYVNVCATRAVKNENRYLAVAQHYDDEESQESSIRGEVLICGFILDPLEGHAPTDGLGNARWRLTYILQVDHKLTRNDADEGAVNSTMVNDMLDVFVAMQAYVAAGVNEWKSQQKKMEVSREPKGLSLGSLGAKLGGAGMVSKIWGTRDEADDDSDEHFSDALEGDITDHKAAESSAPSALGTLSNFFGGKRSSGQQDCARCSAPPNWQERIRKLEALVDARDAEISELKTELIETKISLADSGFSREALGIRHRELLTLCDDATGSC